MSDAFEEFGPYAVYERLGQGGMATVHRAEKRGVGIRRPIALKRLLPHVAADPALVKLFVDEARLAAHLRHTNVAQTYELGKVGDTFFIAMEYASGPTLAQIMRQCLAATGDIPLPISVAILQQVCEALDYAHNLCDESGQSLRIIHRDVSPANIIVTNIGIVKLIDFGIAKATISSVKTQTGFIKGKFGYIAPEYISGKIDARVDLFAIGVVAHEMLTARRLFEGKDDFETLQNIREMNPQPPSRWNRNVPPDLDDIVMTALQRDPADRWQSAGAMQVALSNVARSFGRVVGNQQLAMWVDWAFSQQPGPDRAADSAHDTAAFRGGETDPDGSPSIEPGASDSLEAGMPGLGSSITSRPDPDSSLSIEISRESEVGEATLDGAEPTPQPPAEHAPPAALRPEPMLQPEPGPRPDVAARRPLIPRPDIAARREPATERDLAARRPPVPQPASRTEPSLRPELAGPREPSPRPDVAARRPPATQPDLAARRQPVPQPDLAARRPPSPRSDVAARRQPSPQRMRGPSESDETLPVERFTLTTGDIELLTPSPEIAPPPMLQPAMSASPMPPAMPLARSSRTHDAVPPPGPSPAPPAVAARPPSLAHPRPSRSIDAIVPPQPPTARPSRATDAVSPPPTARPSRATDAVSPPPSGPPSRTVDSVPPPAARTSRAAEAVSPLPTGWPSHSAEAVSPPPTARTSRAADAVSPPPTARTSRAADAVSPPPAVQPPHAADATSPPSTRPSRPFDVALPPMPPPQRRSRPMLPFSAPTPPRASQIGDAVDPPLVPSPAGLDALGTPPHVAASQELEVLARPAPRVPPPPPPVAQRAASLQPEGIPPAASSFELPAASSLELLVAPADVSAEPPAPAAPAPPPAGEVKRATRSRHKATQRTPPPPKPAAESALAAPRAAPAPRRRHDLLWLILLMIVLGAGATAAAYYWPDLW